MTDTDIDVQHPLLVRFEEVATSKKFIKKIQIEYRTFDLLFQVEEIEDGDVTCLIPPTLFIARVEKLTKHIDIIRQKLTPSLGNKSACDLFQVTVSSALDFLTSLMKDLSSLEEPLIITVYTKHRSFSQTRYHILIDFIIDSDVLTLKSRQVINGATAQIGSMIYY